MKNDSDLRKLYIKNMVCPRCITAVWQGLETLGAEVISVDLGYADIKSGDVTDQDIDAMLEKQGFERLRNNHAILLEKVKTMIVTLVHSGTISKLEQPVSDYLEKEVGKNYSALSKLFSQVEGITLEQYFIRQKVERAKELIFYGELNFSEIADQLGYSSVAYFSAQFKNITGQTPSQFKSLRKPGHKTLDRL